MLSRFRSGLSPCAVLPPQMLEGISICALFCCTWTHTLESQDEGLHCCTCIPHTEKRTNNTQIQSSIHYSIFFLRNNLFYSNPGLSPLVINPNSAVSQTKRCNFSEFSLMQLHLHHYFSTDFFFSSRCNINDHQHEVTSKPAGCPV